MNGMSLSARTPVLAVLFVPVVALPLVTGTPLRWGLLPLVAIALITVSVTWRSRLVLVPLTIVLASGAFLLADVPGADVLSLAGMMLVAWLLLSMLRAAVQRGIDAAVRERRSVERSRDLLAAMAEVVSLDPSMTVARVADAVAALGYPLVSVGEVVGGRILDLQTRGVPDGVQLVSLPISEGIAGAAVRELRPIYVDDYALSEYRTAKAPPVPIGSAMAMPIVVDGEAIGAMTGSRADTGRISDQDRRYFEALGAQAARALDVARRYRAEQQVAERLAEFERLKVGFLGSVTADLRGPLTVIRGLAHTLEQQSQTMPTAEAEHLLERINDAVDRLDRMIESLLDFSRTRRTPAEGNVDVPLGELAERAAVAVQNNFVTHRIAVVVEGPCLVDGDPALLEQAVTHLVDNACRHTPADTHVVVTVEERAGIVTVRVADDGPGLPTVVAEAIEVGAVGDLHGTLGFTLVSHILAAHQSRLELGSGDRNVIGFTLAASQSGLGRARAETIPEMTS